VFGELSFGDDEGVGVDATAQSVHGCLEICVVSAVIRKFTPPREFGYASPLTWELRDRVQGRSIWIGKS
jgi:hypothetical protein